MLDEVKTGVQKLLAVINICQYKKKAKYVGHELSQPLKKAVACCKRFSSTYFFIFLKIAILQICNLCFIEKFIHKSYDLLIINTFNCLS